MQARPVRPQADNLGYRQRDVDVGWTAALHLPEDPDDRERLAGHRDCRADPEIMRRGVVGIHHGHPGPGVGGAEPPSGADCSRGVGAEPCVGCIDAFDGESDRVQGAGRRLTARAELRGRRDRDPGVGQAGQAARGGCHAVQARDPRHERLVDHAQVPADQLIDDLGILPRAEGTGTPRRVGRLAGRFGHGDVGPDAVQSVQHGGLRVLYPVGGRGHHDNQANPDGQADCDDRGLADPVLHLAPQVGQEEHACSFSWMRRKVVRRAAGQRVTLSEPSQPGGASGLQGPLSADWNCGEFGSIPLPGPSWPAWPSGSGKSGTPCARMHLAKARL